MILFAWILILLKNYLDRINRINKILLLAEGDWVPRLSSGKPGKEYPVNPVNPV